MEPGTGNGTAFDRRPSVAVVGTGISSLTAAYLHAHTHGVVDNDCQQLAVDSAFIVHNDLTYPWLRKLFGELDVEVRPTEMSMSVRCEGCGLEYAGGRGMRGLFSQRRRLPDPRFMHLLWEVRRFHRRASAFLGGADEVSVARRWQPNTDAC